MLNGVAPHPLAHHVPHADRRVLARRGELRAAGVEGQCADRQRMAAQLGPRPRVGRLGVGLCEVGDRREPGRQQDAHTRGDDGDADPAPGGWAEGLVVPAGGGPQVMRGSMLGVQRVEW
jgi:hypothetical protein